MRRWIFILVAASLVTSVASASILNPSSDFFLTTSTRAPLPSSEVSDPAEAIRLAYDSFNRVTNTMDGWSTNRFTYDILGRVTQAKEIQGVFTQTFDYVFDQGGRLTNVAWKAGTNASLNTRYQYDNLNRITNLVSDSGSFGYAYASNGVLVKTLQYPNGETANYGFDALRRMTNLLYKTSGGSANGQWSYGYDGRDFVIRRTDPSTNSYSYRHDEVGRLIEVLGTKGGTNVTGYPFSYGFDRVGNRVRQVEGGKVRLLTYNVNNQLVNLARSNEVFVAGSVNEAGTGTVVQVKSDSMTNWLKVATRYICQTQAWFETSSVVVTNLGTNTVWIRATDKSGNSRTQTIHAVNSRTNAVFGYDLDGNQTNNLAGSYTWDAENRLVRVDYGTNGSTRMSFDGIGRLREVAEYGTGASPTNVVRYSWNGWLPWAELDASNKVQRTFTWGLDLSSTIGGAGGIGGLMGMRDYVGAGTNYYIRSDGKGNVTEIRRGSDAVVVATYAYAPFGAVLSNSGSFNQPFKFQTKLSHTRSGLGYWGFRWYDYKTGRWLGRDSLGEAGGLNLYGYCGGNPSSYCDPDGQNPVVVAALIGGVFLLLNNVDTAYAPGPCDETPSTGDASIGMMGDAAMGLGIGTVWSKAAQWIRVLRGGQTQIATGNIIHRGARAYQGESHVYSIRAPDGSYYKIGKSSRGVRVSDEASIRAEHQVCKLNSKDMDAGGVGGYESEIRKTFGSSGDALDYESALRDRYRRMYGEDLLPGNREHLRGKGGLQ